MGDFQRIHSQLIIIKVNLIPKFGLLGKQSEFRLLFLISYHAKNRLKIHVLKQLFLYNLYTNAFSQDLLSKQLSW